MRKAAPAPAFERHRDDARVRSYILFCYRQHPVQPFRAPVGPQWPYVLVPGLHPLTALTGPAYYLYATSVPVIGANIGAGLGLLWTACWGLPWSLVPLNATGTSSQQDFVAVTACALFNVALVAIGFFLLYRRAATRMHVKTDRPAAPRAWHYFLVPLVALLSVLLYVTKISGVPFGRLSIEVLPLLLVMIGMLLVLALVPGLITWLPNLVFGP